MTQFFVGVMTNVDARSYDESFTVYGPWTREQANERALSVVLEHNEWRVVGSRFDEFDNEIVTVRDQDDDDGKEQEVKVFRWANGDVVYVEIYDGEEALVIEACQS